MPPDNINHTQKEMDYKLDLATWRGKTSERLDIICNKLDGLIELLQNQATQINENENRSIRNEGRISLILYLLTGSGATGGAFAIITKVIGMW